MQADKSYKTGSILFHELQLLDYNMTNESNTTDKANIPQVLLAEINIQVCSIISEVCYYNYCC